MPAHVVFDLSGLAFIDSSGINALVQAVRTVEAAGGTGVVSAPSARGPARLRHHRPLAGRLGRPGRARGAAPAAGGDPPTSRRAPRDPPASTATRRRRAREASNRPSAAERRRFGGGSRSAGSSPSWRSRRSAACSRGASTTTASSKQLNEIRTRVVLAGRLFDTYFGRSDQRAELDRERTVDTERRHGGDGGVLRARPAEEREAPALQRGSRLDRSRGQLPGVVNAPRTARTSTSPTATTSRR